MTEPQPKDDGKITEQFNIPDYAIGGVAMVKIEKDVEPKLSVTMTRSGKLATGVAELDNLFNKYEVYSLTPIFHVKGDRFEERKRNLGLHLWYEVRFDKNRELKEVIQELAKLRSIDEVDYSVPIVGIGDSEVKIVSEAEMEAITRGTRSAMPFNDPQLPAQWHYHNDGVSYTNSVAGADINLFKAWETTTGAGDIIVAVFDSGLDINHEDLKANLWVNTNKSDDNPYKDGVHGWNFSGVGEGSDLSTPENFHGTHVSGTVSAVTNNGIGVAGVAGGDGTPDSGAKIMTIQLARDGKWASDMEIAKAFIYAADNGAVIAQNSWGSVGEETPNLIAIGIDYFIDYAGIDEKGNVFGPTRGGVVVFAAGNSGHTAPLSPVIPGSYPRALSVANMQPDYDMNFTSTFGKWVSVTAPGGALADGEANPNNGVVYNTENEVLSTVMDNEYGYSTGTSMAAPHVSGIAALVIDAYRKQGEVLKGEQVKALIINSTRNIDSYLTDYYVGNIGSGLVDAYAAINMGDFHSTPDDVTDLAGDWSQRETIAIEWSVVADSRYGVAPTYEIMIGMNDLTGVDFDNPPEGVAMGVYNIKAGQTVGSKMTGGIGGLRANTKYYIAVSALGKYYDRSENIMVISGTTSKGSAPEPVTDLTAAWNVSGGNLSVDLNWSVTRDEDTYTPTHYEILVSEADLSGADFDNPPQGAQKFEVEVEGELGSKMSYTVEGLKVGVEYYLAMTGVDYDAQRSATTMIYYDGTKEVITPEIEGELTLYPNPVRTTLNVATDLKSTKRFDIAFYNAEGVKMLDNSLMLSNKIVGKIDVSKLSGGAYTVVVKYDGKQIKRRIVKQ